MTGGVEYMHCPPCLKKVVFIAHGGRHAAQHLLNCSAPRRPAHSRVGCAENSGRGRGGPVKIGIAGGERAGSLLNGKGRSRKSGVGSAVREQNGKGTGAGEDSRAREEVRAQVHAGALRSPEGRLPWAVDELNRELAQLW
eukprot:6099809-Pleurochrysis_carterae.AAC.1